MEAAQLSSAGQGQGGCLPTFPPLESVTKPNLTTSEAAYYLNRRDQTLRIWAAYQTGPLQPRRMGGRLDWPTSKVKQLAGVA